MKSTKYPRTYHFPFSLGTTSDDRISKDYTFVENIPIIITEKLDGQNDAISKNGVYARSHGTPTQHPWDNAIWDIWNRIKNDLDEDTYIFGENMYAIHSIQYKQLESYYYIFGVRIKDEWLSWDDVKEWAYLLDLPTVPVLFQGNSNNVKSIIETLVKSPSTFDGFDVRSNDNCMEGIVCRKENSFHSDDFSTSVLKWVRGKHVNTDEHWTRNWKRQPLKWEIENLKK